MSNYAYTTDAQLLAAAAALPVFYFDDDEWAFSLAAEAGGVFALKVADVLGQFRRATAAGVRPTAVFDMAAARMFYGLHGVPGARVVLVVGDDVDDQDVEEIVDLVQIDQVIRTHEAVTDARIVADI